MATVQWDGSANGGFTGAGTKSWMRVNDSYTEINVAKQLEDPNSVLKFWKQMIQFRKAHSNLLVHGTFEALGMQDKHTFAFVKKHGGEKALVVLNFSENEQQVDVPTGDQYVFKVGNYNDGSQRADKARLEGSRVTLRPWEGQLYIHNTSL